MEVLILDKKAIDNFLNEILKKINTDIFTKTDQNNNTIYFVSTDLEDQWFNFIANSHYQDNHFSLSNELEHDYLLDRKFSYCQSCVFSALSHAKYNGIEKLDFSKTGDGFRRMQMNYNANCTEQAIVKAFENKLKYDSAEAHLYSFSGYGKNSADLYVDIFDGLVLNVSMPVCLSTGKIKKQYLFHKEDKFEVKDYYSYKNLYTALHSDKIEFHDAQQAFVHLIGDYENRNKVYLITKDKQIWLVDDIKLSYDHKQIRINCLVKNKIIDVEYWRKENEK